MNTNLYNQFLSFNDLGLKSEAKSSLASFIASFESHDEVVSWVYSYLKQLQDDRKIRYELFKELIYPVLLDGYLKKDVDSTLWLAKTIENLFEIRSLHPVLSQKGKVTLCKEAYNLSQNEQTRTELLRTLIEGFNYSQHEWPAGILIDSNGANKKDCEEIIQDIALSKILDNQKEYDYYLADYESKVHEYIIRVQVRNPTD